MNITFLHGYPDQIGKREAWVGFGVGPTSYSTSTKDVLNFPRTVAPGTTGYVDTVLPAVTVSGTYMVVAVPSGTGPRVTWKLVWYTISGMTEVTNATNLSAEKVQLSGFSGTY